MNSEEELKDLCPMHPSKSDEAAVWDALKTIQEKGCLYILKTPAIPLSTLPTTSFSVVLGRSQ